MANRITPEEVEHFISLYQAGTNTPEISQLTGRSLRAVCYSLKKAGIELRAEQPAKAAPEVEQQVLRLYRDGKFRSEVAEAAGVSEASVTNILRRLGIEPDWFDAERRAKWAALAGDRSKQPTWVGESAESLILALYAEDTLWEEIASQAGVSIKTVANVLARHGITATRWFKATPQQRLQAMQLLAGGADPAAISAATGLAEAAIRKFTAHSRPSVFRDIGTPETAYWLGFLNADGSILGVNPGTLRLQVALARKDRAHLVKLRAFLGTEREIWDYEAKTIGGVLRPYSRLICQERPVVMDLVRHGILPNKTGAEKPWDGPVDLMRHYWRGMVDGDGSVPGKSFTVTLSGSHEVVSAFVEWARGVCGTGINPTRDKRSPDHWRAIMGGRSAVLALLDVLYADVPVALDRKVALADLALQGKPADPALF
jgi:transposase